MKTKVYGYDGYCYLYKGILYKVWKVEKSYNATTFDWYIKCNDNDGTDVLGGKVGCNSYTSRGAAIDNAKYYIDIYLARVINSCPNPTDYGLLDFNEAVKNIAQIQNLRKFKQSLEFHKIYVKWVTQRIDKLENINS
jgi:hypothetical protein